MGQTLASIATSVLVVPASVALEAATPAKLLFLHDLASAALECVRVAGAVPVAAVVPALVSVRPVWSYAVHVALWRRWERIDRHHWLRWWRHRRVLCRHCRHLPHGRRDQTTRSGEANESTKLRPLPLPRARRRRVPDRRERRVVLHRGVSARERLVDERVSLRGVGLGEFERLPHLMPGAREVTSSVRVGLGRPHGAQQAEDVAGGFGRERHASRWRQARGGVNGASGRCLAEALA